MWLWSKSLSVSAKSPAARTKSESCMNWKAYCWIRPSANIRTRITAGLLASTKLSWTSSNWQRAPNGKTAQHQNVILKSQFLYLLVSHRKMMKTENLLNFSKPRVSLGAGGARQSASYVRRWLSASPGHLVSSGDCLGQYVAHSAGNCKWNYLESLQETKNMLNYREFIRRFPC